MNLLSGRTYYWRFKGEKAYRYGYATLMSAGMFRMGLYNGDKITGPIVDINDIESKSA